MDDMERAEIYAAINKMIRVFESELEWDVMPLLRIEVCEYRNGDFTMGERIIIDQITEYSNLKKDG